MPIKNIDKSREALSKKQKRAELHARHLSPLETLSGIIGDIQLDFLLKHIKGVSSRDTLERQGEITVVCVSPIPDVQTLYDALAALTRDGFAYWIPTSSVDGFNEEIYFSSWDAEFSISDELRAQERFVNAVAVCKATYKILYTLGEREFIVEPADDNETLFVISRREDGGDE